MASIKTKLTIAVVKRLISSIDRAVDAQETMAMLLAENTKALSRIIELLDEQADIQAQTRDALENS